MTRLTRFLDRQSRWKIAAAVLPLHGLFYSIPNHLTARTPQTLPLTVVDRLVPFVPEAIWIYLSAYVLVILSFLMRRTTASSSRAIYAFATVTLLGTSVHFFYPTTFDRASFPILPQLDALSRTGMWLLRSLDSPASCLPSLHVALAVLAALLHVHRRRRFVPMALWASAIAVSTLLTKQHYLIDVLAGAGLSIAVYLAWFEVPHLRATSAPAGGPRAETCDRG